MTTRRRLEADATHEDLRRLREGKVSGVRPAVRSSQRVLLVDAHDDALHFMAYVLRRHGHAVVLANSIEASLAAASLQKFDVVVSNVELPDGTGMTLLKRLQETSRVRGIALCAGESDERVILDAGFEYKMQKPVRINTLSNAVLALGS